MYIVFVKMLPKNIRKKEGIMHCKGFYNCRITFSDKLFPHSHLIRNYCLVICLESEELPLVLPMGQRVDSTPFGSVVYFNFVFVLPPRLKISLAECKTLG